MSIDPKTLHLPVDRVLIKTAARVKELLNEIYEIEADDQAPAIEKLSRVRKIKEELNLLGQQVDNIKREFNLLTHYRVN